MIKGESRWGHGRKRPPLIVLVEMPQPGSGTQETKLAAAGTKSRRDGLGRAGGDRGRADCERRAQNRGNQEQTNNTKSRRHRTNRKLNSSLVGARCQSTI